MKSKYAVVFIQDNYDLIYPFSLNCEIYPKIDEIKVINTGFENFNDARIERDKLDMENESKKLKDTEFRCGSFEVVGCK
jgi:hypothetical protein